MTSSSDVRRRPTVRFLEFISLCLRQCDCFYIALGLLTWVVFFQVCRFDFVNLDDGVYVFENRHVLAGLSLDNLRWSFSWAATDLTGNWHPLTWLSLMLDAQIYGSKPGGFHFTNVLMQTANVLILYAVLKQMTASRYKSAFVAALFAVHPLKVESVAWIVERKDVLSTLLGLISIWAYVRYTRCSQARWYLFALAAYALSLLSKSMLVTLPFMLLLFDYWPLRRLQVCSSNDKSSSAPADFVNKEMHQSGLGRDWWRLVLEKLPFFVLTIVFCSVTLLSAEKGGSIAPYSFALRTKNAVVVYVLYMSKTFWPVNLSCYYPFPPTIGWMKVAGSVGLIAIVTIVAVVQRRHRPYLLVGWFWYLGGVLPTIGLIKAGLPRMCDRYSYLPGVGLFVAVTWLVPTILPFKRKWRYVLPITAYAILLASTVAGWVQTSYWQNSITLFEHALAVTEQNDLIHYNLAISHYRLGDVKEAIYHYQRARDIDPKNIATRINLGNVLADQGRYNEATSHLEHVLSIDPNNVLAHNNLGLILHLRGQRQQAMRLFQQALRIDAQNAQAQFNLGNVLADEGRLDEAIPHFREALRLAPRFEAARANLHRALGQ